MRRFSLWRLFRATLRDARLILRDTWLWLLLLIGVWIGFSLLIWRYYDVVLSFDAAMYVAFGQMILEPQPLPSRLWLQACFYLAPALTVVLVGRGALNIGFSLIDRRNHREGWQMALASTCRDHVIVCGLGKVGYRVVMQLLEAGRDVVAIEIRPDALFNELLISRDIPVLIGDPRQRELLIQAGIADAYSVVSATGDDLTNLDIALTARELRPTIHIVMRVFNESLSEKLATAFQIQTAFSTSALAAPTLAAAAIAPNITNALYVAGRLLSTVELKVARGGILDNRLVGTIEHTYDVSVLYIRNIRGEDLRPRNDYRLDASDEVVVIGELKALSEIQRLNQPEMAPHIPYDI